MKAICSKHPKYQGKRKPTADCQACRELYEMVSHPRGYTTVLGYDDGSGIRIQKD